MSNAHKCDRCNTLYEPEPGTAYINEIGVRYEHDGMCQTWSGIDLCLACAREVLVLLHKALWGLPDTLRKAGVEPLTTEEPNP